MSEDLRQYPGLRRFRDTLLERFERRYWELEFQREIADWDDVGPILEEPRADQLRQTQQDAIVRARPDITPLGCICPVRAEETCQGLMCPRRCPPNMFRAV